MLEKFKQIRIYVNDGPGHGSAAANVHLLRWLWTQGFTGLMDIIYDDGVAPKVKVVFDLPDHFCAGAIHTARDGRVQLMSVAKYVEMRDSLPDADFGLRAAGNTEIDTDIAYFLKAKVVMAFSPFQNGINFSCGEQLSKLTDHYLVTRGSSAITLPPCGIESLPIRYPAPSMADALAFLRQAQKDNPNSIRLRNLSQLLESVINGEVISWPIYGLNNNFILPFEAILLKLVITIHALRKNNNLNKPVVMMLFNSFQNRTFTQIQSTLEQVSAMYQDSEIIPPFIEDVIASLQALSVLDINVDNMSSVMMQMGLFNTTMINIGRTEATIFEALLTHVGNFTLPPLVEGENARGLLRNEEVAAFTIGKYACQFKGVLADVTAETVTQFRENAKCALTSPLQLESAGISASEREIRMLVKYIEAVNNPSSALMQDLTLDPTQSDRFTVGIQFMLEQMQLPTAAGLTNRMQRQLLKALKQGDAATINTLLRQYDITQWHDLTGRRFLWTLLTQGHWHVFETLTPTQLNHTLIHVPFTAVLGDGRSRLSDMLSNSHIAYGPSYSDVGFLLSSVVACIKRIGAAAIDASPLQKDDYILLMMLSQEQRALSLAAQQQSIQPFLEASIGARKAYLLDSLPFYTILPEFFSLPEWQISTIFSSITPNLLSEWKKSNATHLDAACSGNYVSSLLLNQHFSNLTPILGNITLTEQFILPSQLFMDKSRIPIDELIGRISFLLAIATEKVRNNILQSVTHFSKTYLDPEACHMLTQRFNLSLDQQHVQAADELLLEHSRGIFSQLDCDYPSLYAFGLSFIKAMIETSMTQHQICSVRQAQIITAFCMIVLGAMFADWTFILNGFISIALTCVLPEQTLWPIALLVVSIGRDLYDGEAIIDCLTTNAQRALMGIAGGLSGKQAVTWFRGRGPVVESAVASSDLSDCERSAKLSPHLERSN